jgi:multisubunit Na+/H+ antiporter MnhB subunit
MKLLRSVILETTVRVVFDAALVLSVYFLFAGHNQPGGGFIGGLVAGAAVALRYVAGGVDSIRTVVGFRPWMALSVGLALACGTALSSMFVGDGPLDQRAFEWTLPLLGDVKLTTATIFDAGVYLIVVGLALMIIETLGEDTEPDQAFPEPDDALGEEWG